uniref:Uncharacterized protein n=1 Tax=Rhizophora mucronata TaxID=61149 RepID=A0A2P2J2J9_RHIMU
MFTKFLDYLFFLCSHTLSCTNGL